MLLDKSQVSLLVVDDDSYSCELLSRRLEREGFQVESATSGDEAIRHMQVERFDLVLLDRMMPDISGEEVLQYLRSTPTLSNMAVIMVTADNDKDSVIRCLAAGADDYIVKPYNMPLVKTRIWRSLKSRALSGRGSIAEFTILNAAKVLVVDDNDQDRDVLSRRVERFGCIPVAASSGEQALQRLSDTAVDIVLLDVTMPGMDGVAVLNRIRERHDEDSLPVIMITARDEPEMLDTCIRSSANDYMTKPFNAATLRARMLTCLKLSRHIA